MIMYRIFFLEESALLIINEWLKPVRNKAFFATALFFRENTSQIHLMICHVFLLFRVNRFGLKINIRCPKS